MVYAKPLSRIPWEDQFRTPTLADLRSHYNRQLGQLVDTARARLLDYPSASEQLEWMGLPWRWTLVYRCPGDPTQAWAYIIPHRDKPIIACPLTEGMIGSFPMPRIRKFVRDGLDHAHSIDGVRWVAWEVTNKTHLELVLELLKRKHKFFSARN